ncbi:GEVED domain-containing protein [Paenimyroides baculatum]|uniref:T9SS type A sorting domain-containing protein n=1 Tax=Paenimyroides baculatum TaxID=2608000 RepID=A0A5M6CCB6_9FLAO|nr:GEVED domain-containing protein [Paenimyroides baculatum]KAA5532776.1 T9SS type A sorting domain-containing protein [Paenimyroides baculatum]
MKNFYSKLMMGFLLLSTSTINAQTTNYCAPTWSGWAVNEPTEPITSVQFGTGTGSINNTTSATVSASTPRYEDFSTTSMNVQRGQTYDLKVKGNTDGNNTNYITIYFDWNGDGVFSNATPANAAAQQVLINQPEKHQHTTAIINSTGTDNIEMVHSVTIPTDAVLGSIRMRVVKNYNAPSPTPCANPFIFGQVEDYTLNITNGSCPAVSSFSENFDASTLTCCNMGVVPQCWHSISTATGANQIISNTTPASGTNNIYQFGYGTNLQSIVVMPEVNNINAGTHQFRFKLRANSGSGNLDFGYITDITNASTFVIIQTINVTNSSYNDPIAERTLTVPTTVPSTARLAIRNPGTSFAGFYWDDANWEPIPQTVCADPGPNVGDTGCVTFTYDGVSKTHKTVRGADENIWLQQNLGSTQVATTMTDANSYGDVYQWGRWNDGHEKRTSTTTTVPTTNNPSGLTTTSNSFIIGSSTDWWDGGSITDTWSAVSSSNTSATEGCDPCKAIGAGWVMPTETDWTGIKTAESISNPATAFASNLKLPASGYRSSSTGNYTFVDQRGYYWSSTTSTLGGKYFYVGSTIANPSAGAMRGQGHAVRCIYKTAVSVNTVAVTTQNNVAATITAANGTLQLQAAITPTTANQAVTWSVQSGSTSASVDNTGLVTGLTNGTAIIRATSVADTTKFGELTVTVNIPTANPCTAVQTFLETFDTFTAFPENCWTANYPNYPTVDLNGTTNKAIQLYSGNQPNDVILVSPEVSTIDGQHQLVFDIVSTNGAGTTVQIGTMTDNTDFSTFAAVGPPFSPSIGSHSTQAIPANAGHKYVAIRFIHGGGHGKVLVVDNVEWKQITASNDKFDADKVRIYPNPTTGMFFIDTDIDVKSIEIYNTSGQRILKTNQKNINLENASNGLYIVNVYATDGTHASYKIIKK